MKFSDPIVQELIALLLSYVAKLANNAAKPSLQQTSQTVVDENINKALVAEHALTQYMETENISVDSLVEIIDKLKFVFGEFDD